MVANADSSLAALAGAQIDGLSVVGSTGLFPSGARFTPNLNCGAGRSLNAWRHPGSFGAADPSVIVMLDLPRISRYGQSDFRYGRKPTGPSVASLYHPVRRLPGVRIATWRSFRASFK